MAGGAQCTTKLVHTSKIDLVYYASSTAWTQTSGDDGRRAGGEMAHGVLQRGAGNLRALRHRGAASGSGGPVGPERGALGVSVASETGSAELVRARRAHRGARRQRVGPPPNREEIGRASCRERGESGGW